MEENRDFPFAFLFVCLMAIVLCCFCGSVFSIGHCIPQSRGCFFPFVLVLLVVDKPTVYLVLVKCCDHSVGLHRTIGNSFGEWVSSLGMENLGN